MGYPVVMTVHAFRRALNEALARHGIPFRQGQVLAWLALETDLAQSGLAERVRARACQEIDADDLE